MFDIDECLMQAEEMMEMAIIHLEDEFAHIRAGKANVRILDDIRVDSYGSMVSLNNVGEKRRNGFRCRNLIVCLFL